MLIDHLYTPEIFNIQCEHCGEVGSFQAPVSEKHIYDAGWREAYYVDVENEVDSTDTLDEDKIPLCFECCRDIRRKTLNHWEIYKLMEQKPPEELSGDD